MKAPRLAKAAAFAAAATFGTLGAPPLVRADGNAMVLSLLSPDSMTDANENIEAIRSEYEKECNQASVLR